MNCATRKAAVSERIKKKTEYMLRCTPQVQLLVYTEGFDFC